MDMENLDDSIEALERQLAALDEDDDPDKNEGSNPAQKKPSQKVYVKTKENEADCGLDEDPTIAAFERELAAMENGEDENTAQATPEKTKNSVVVSEQKSSSAFSVNMDGGEDYAEAKDKNGVPESVLIEEEDIYHKKDKIVSAGCLGQEIENYINPIIDGELVGEDYRDILSMAKDEWEIYIDRLGSQIQSGKISLGKYKEIIEMGLSSQKNLLELGLKKKASKTTIDRIKNRISIITTEISEVVEQLKQSGESVAEEPKEQEPAPKKQKPAQAQESPAKLQVKKEKLEELSDRLNEYIYLALYWKSTGVHSDDNIMQQTLKVKSLFDNPHKITPQKYKDAMEILKPIPIELVLGMKLEERDAKIEMTLEKALETFEKMKTFGVGRDDAKATCDTIKYLRKIKEKKTVPFPQIQVRPLEVTFKGRTNHDIPDDCVRFTLTKLSGAANHRVFFVKYFFNYKGAQQTGDSNYVTSLLTLA